MSKEDRDRVRAQIEQERGLHRVFGSEVGIKLTRQRMDRDANIARRRLDREMGGRSTMTPSQEYEDYTW